MDNTILKKKSIKVIAIFVIIMLLALTLYGCGLKEITFKDKTAKLESNASKGSITTILGKYNVQGLSGNYAIYCKDGSGFISQHGTYKFKDGKVIVKYKMSNASTAYSVEQSDNNVIILKNGKTKLTCTYKNGTDGLNTTDYKKFTGTYSLGENTYMIFKDNGNFRQVQTFKYKVSGHKLSLTYGTDTQKYTWKISNNKICIQQKGSTIEKLTPSVK